MIRIIKVANVEKFAARVVPKPAPNRTAVESIMCDVRRNGDKAITKYEKRFSGADIALLRVSRAEIRRAYREVSRTELDALHTVKSRLEKTERAIKLLLKDQIITINGIKIAKRFVPINSVGCYIPGGLAQYPSSVIMSAVPAKIAGVGRIVAVSPPNPDGTINPLTVVAADMCGVGEIYKTGGAQAVAALSYGTRTIPKVDKIVGPGGPFVTVAKYLSSDQTGIDMLAGPTELGIIADSSASPRLVALDLISQAEHSGDTLCYLITTSERLAKSVQKAISKLLPTVKRKNIIQSSLKKNGFAAVCKTASDVANLANRLAPEHLQIMTKDPRSFASKITTPGLILLGSNSPSSASDYLLGSNHILPTCGFGRVRGPLSVIDFVKMVTQVESSRSSLSEISRHLEALTEAEGLPNHYEAVRERLK